MKMKKVLSVLFAMCLTFSLLAGCSSTDEPNAVVNNEVNEAAEVEKALSQYLDSYFDKILDEDALIQQYAGDSIASMPDNIASVFEPKAREFCSKIFAEFKYDIADVTVNGDKANANVTLTLPDVDNIDFDFENIDPTQLLTEEEMAEIMTINPNDADAQAKFIEKLIGRVFDSIIEKLETTQQTQDVTLTKGDAGWTVDEQSLNVDFEI